MPRSREARDLQRDPRFALHGASEDPLRARAEAGEEADPEDLGDFHLFRAEIEEVVVVGLNEARERLVIEHWHEGRGLSRLERE